MNRGKRTRRATAPGSVWSVAVCILGLTLAPEGNSLAATESSDELRAAQFEQVKEIAREEGAVRVIVQLDVPDIGPLTTASTGAKDPQEAVQADAALATAIGAVTQAELAKLAGIPHAINHTYTTIPFIAMTVQEDALTVLETSRGILGINEDRPVPPTLDNTVHIVGASAAWAQGIDGTKWYVAVLDTGIRDTHNFFKGKSIVQACFASGQSGPGDCPNGTSEDTTSPHAAQHHPQEYDGWNHGTHVSGIAVGNDPTKPLYGVAKGADLIAVQVFSKVTGAQCAPHAKCVLTYTADYDKGLEYVYGLRTHLPIAAVNMSLGGGKYSDQTTCDNDNASTKTAIDNLRAAGIPTVIASGNDGYCDGISSPGCISSAVAVGATGDDDDEADFSNYHADLLDLYAPGVWVNSSVGTGDDAYDSWSGTSMAAPHVTGAWALMKKKSPSAGVDSILTAFQTTGAAVDGRCVAVPAQRRIDIGKAMGALLVPTVSVWGLIILSLLLMVSAKVYFGRRVTRTALA